MKLFEKNNWDTGMICAWIYQFILSKNALEQPIWCGIDGQSLQIRRCLVGFPLHLYTMKISNGHPKWSVDSIYAHFARQNHFEIRLPHLIWLLAVVLSLRAWQHHPDNFSDWGKLISDTVIIAAALLGKVLHYAPS